MKTALLGCKGTTLDLLDTAVSQSTFRIDHVVTLPAALASTNKIAFFKGSDLKDYCAANQIPVHEVASYNLKDAADVEFFEAAKFDLLLVIGWERLIPGRTLQTLGKFACGMHGSPFGLPRGRGRSPLNWSIIGGHSRFVTYLFRYNEAIDDGDIIGFKVFEINQFDTIASLHMKNRIAMGQLLKQYVPLIESDTLTTWPQPPGTATYYPKRSAEDGHIDWRRTTREIYDLVRAVGPPYPPAFSYHEGSRMYILEASPFDAAMFDDGILPGTVVDVSIALGQFVVRTGDGTLLVKSVDREGVHRIKVLDYLPSADHRAILRNVIERYPPQLADNEKEI